MKRPLEKRGNEGFSWHMSVMVMQDEDGFSCPIFTWSFESVEDGLSAGWLQAWPLGPPFLFIDAARESSLGEFSEVENALSKIDQYGWGEPPHIDEVFKDMMDVAEKFPIEGPEAARAIFEELQAKWENLIQSNPTSAPKNVRTASKDWDTDFWERQLTGINVDLNRPKA